MRLQSLHRRCAALRLKERLYNREVMLCESYLASRLEAMRCSIFVHAVLNLMHPVYTYILQALRLEEHICRGLQASLVSWQRHYAITYMYLLMPYFINSLLFFNVDILPLKVVVYRPNVANLASSVTGLHKHLSCAIASDKTHRKSPASAEAPNHSAERSTQARISQSDKPA